MYALSSRSRTAAAFSSGSSKLARAAAAVLEPLERRSLLSAGGVLSTAFTDVANRSDTGGAVFRLPDQKLLQAGLSFDDNFTSVFSLARFNADGTPDDSFGTNGSNVVIDSLPDSAYSIGAVNAIAVNPATGRIIVVGRADSASGSDFLVAAFTPDGILDGGFGAGGVTISDFTPGKPNEARAVAIDGDSIIVAGSDLLVDEVFAVARYDGDGKLDDAFGVHGVSETPFLLDADGTNSRDIVHAVALDKDHNIILAGSSQADFNGEMAPVIALQRYNADGKPDVSFGVGGAVRVDVPAPAVTALGDKAYSVVVDAQGRILVGGTTDGPVPSSDDFVLLRFNSDGSLDGDFDGADGGNGIVRTYFGGFTSGLISDLAIQSDGAILVGGNVLTCTDESCGDFSNSFAVGRYDASGRTDPTFGSGPVPGVVLTQNFQGGRPEMNLATIALQSDADHNQFLALGSWMTRDSDDLLLVRFALSGASVKLTGPATANEGDNLIFTATFSGGIAEGINFIQEQHRAEGSAAPLPSTTVSYDWKITVDGQADPIASGSGTATDTLNIPLTPADNGVYHVFISINNGAGSDTADITVNNVSPTATINGAPASSPEGTGISLTSTVSDPGTADTFTYAWAVTKNGSAFASGSTSTLSFTPDDNGSYLVTLAVTDDDGGVGSDSRTIIVTNVAPSAAINGAPASSPEGTGISMSSTVNDPGSADTFTYDWSVTKNGNSFASGSASSFSFTPDDNGAYLVTLTVTDDDGGVGTDSKSITVTNVAPTATINGAPASSPEASGISLSSSVSDPGSADTFTYAWSVTKNGSAFAAGNDSTFSFTPDDNGSYVVTLTVTDDDNGMGSDSRTIIVSNVAPAVDPISGPSIGDQGSPQTFTSAFTDPGSADTWIVTWTFGDGTSLTTAGSPGSISASHTYLTSGTYTVSVSVTDDDGGSESQTSSITISSSNTGTLQIQGTDGDDDISVKAGVDGTLIVEVNKVQTVYSGITLIVINAGAGDDKVKVNPDVSQTAIVFGGDGDDSIKGGGGDDILIGGNGDDLLHGDGGRDVLIGGWGRDRLIGNADSDILVAGYSTHDSDVSALSAILAEWTSARSYGQRTANVMGRDVVVAGNRYFFGGERNNGNAFLTPDGPNATVFDDNQQDMLTGSADQDLFLFNGDTGIRDVLTGLSADELAADIDFLSQP